MNRNWWIRCLSIPKQYLIRLFYKLKYCKESTAPFKRLKLFHFDTILVFVCLILANSYDWPHWELQPTVQHWVRQTPASPSLASCTVESCTRGCNVSVALCWHLASAASPRSRAEPWLALPQRLRETHLSHQQTCRTVWSVVVTKLFPAESLLLLLAYLL